MRVEYIGKSVADLGVNLGNYPPLASHQWEGLRFARPALDWWQEKNYEENVEQNVSVGIEREDDADVLVLYPGWDEDPYELIVVVVNQRCLQNPRLLQWLKLILGRDPDGPHSALVFVPEAQPGRKRAAYDLGQNIPKVWIDARAVSYYPTLVNDAPRTVRPIQKDPRFFQRH